MNKAIGGSGGDGIAKAANQIILDAAALAASQKDSLNSNQYATIVDLISEGEIQGLVGGAQGIYLDNTPLQNANGTLNFADVSADSRNGTQYQTSMPTSSDISNEISVNVAITASATATRSITDPTVGAVKVTLTFPRLEWFNPDNANKKTGEFKPVGVSVRLQIQVQYNNGGFNVAIDDTVTGRSANSYQRQYRVNRTGAFPMDVRVVRITADATKENYYDTIQWTSYTELTYGRLSYPNSALVSLRFNAERFGSIPFRSYRVRGIKVKIPSNVSYIDQNNGRLVYNGGIWNGVFAAAQWTTDPAWILWDLLTSKRYGFGDHIDAAKLDKWSFLSASQYCAELVPDGFNGYEPRFSCNVNIQTAEDAYKLIADMSSVFRAMPFWSGGTVAINQDRPADTAYLFTLANVSSEGFSYQGSSLKQRPTVAVVSYLDLAIRDIAYEEVQDQAAISRNGIIKVDISAFACTSRGQAHRIGEWLLYSEQYEGSIINFTTSIDAGVIVRPGQIIEVADPMRSGSRRSGRIMAATSNTITIDSLDGISALGSGTISVILPSGIVQKRTYVSRSGSIVTVTPSFTTIPNTNSIWGWETTTIQTSTWRVLGIKEENECQYSVTAISYNSSKYNYVERNVPLVVRDITDLNIVPPSPSNLVGKEILYEQNGNAESAIIISWQAVAGVAQYLMRYRLNNNNWLTINLARTDYQIDNSVKGVYKIELYALSAASLPSIVPAQLTFSAYGKTAPPSDVTGLSLVPIDNASAILSWTRVLDLDVLLGGKILIRHSMDLVNAAWEQAAEIVAAAAGSQTQKQVPILRGTYLVKAEDDTGNRSVNASLVITELPTPQLRQLVLAWREDTEVPPFQGNYSNMEYSSSQGAIVLGSGTLWDDFALIDSLPAIDAVSGSNTRPTGEYEFGSNYDLGGIFDLNIRRVLSIAPFVPLQLIDQKVALIDDWVEIDESAPDTVNALTYVRSTDDNPTLAPVWRPWQEFSNAIVRGRGFQFKTIATTLDVTHNIAITKLGVDLEFQQRIDQPTVLFTSTAGTFTVTYVAPFYQVPMIGITAYNMVTGDYFAISAVTRTNFQITFFSSTGTAVSRQFTYIVVGFGREII